MFGSFGKTNFITNNVSDFKIIYNVTAVTLVKLSLKSTSFCIPNLAILQK